MEQALLSRYYGPEGSLLSKTPVSVMTRDLGCTNQSLEELGKSDIVWKAMEDHQRKSPRLQEPNMDCNAWRRGSRVFD